MGMEIAAHGQERKKQYVDVTREIVFEHERQIACNGDLAGKVCDLVLDLAETETWRKRASHLSLYQEFPHDFPVVCWWSSPS